MEMHGWMGRFSIIRLNWSSKTGHGSPLAQIAVHVVGVARRLGSVGPQHRHAGTARPRSPVVQFAHGRGHAVKTIRHAGRVVSIASDDDPALARPGSAAGMPDRRSLEIHLLAVSERIATFCTSGTCRVEVIVIPRLQHLAGYKPA